MKVNDLKYILAYLTPISSFVAISIHGVWSFLTVIIAFFIIPVIEQFARGNGHNLNRQEETKKSVSLFFDILLYLNLPVLYILLWCYFSAITSGILFVWEMVGMTASIGISLGTIGINVAHELGHRKKRYEQWMAKALLATALYTQFYVEHNRGHHQWVATEEDPSSARLGENLYQFWLRSISGVYIQAWRLENERLRKMGRPVVSISNEMIWLQTAQIVYLLAVLIFFGWMGVVFSLLIAMIAILELETVNYIEHYGLRRKKLVSGHYEKVGPQHSWNSNHEIGRILLYELTRHSDHHFKATRKYQVLRHFDNSPQLPHGYPASMMMALIPPLWFSVMDKRIPSV